jgi:hypothetical protein
MKRRTSMPAANPAAAVAGATKPLAAWTADPKKCADGDRKQGAELSDDKTHPRRGSEITDPDGGTSVLSR